MLKKLQALAVLMCMSSYAVGGTVSIGTASARGNMRVDSYSVKGNATLFDGSVVETGQATADLRLTKGTEITMSTDSLGTLYSDHLVLQRGESELAVTSSFHLQANGLRVTSTGPSSRAVVSIKPGNTVEVAVLTGSFGVTNEQGVLLANVRSGLPVSFAMQAGGNPTYFSGVGMISCESGHYFLTDNADVKYEVIGKGLKKSYCGTKVQISGNVHPLSAPVAGASFEISESSIAINAAIDAGIGTGTSLLICGTVVAAGVGLGVGINAATQSSTPASR
jgi:hypothetical protein